MSDIAKGFFICIIVFLLWSGLCFGTGYLLSNSRATERINEANRELAEQQQRYEELIREAEERVDDIREQLSTKLSSSDKTAKELSNIIEQIKRQRIDI